MRRWCARSERSRSAVRRTITNDAASTLKAIDRPTAPTKSRCASGRGPLREDISEPIAPLAVGAALSDVSDRPAPTSDVRMRMARENQVATPARGYLRVQSPCARDELAGPAARSARTVSATAVIIWSVVGVPLEEWRLHRRRRRWRIAPMPPPDHYCRRGQRP